MLEKYGIDPNLDYTTKEKILWDKGVYKYYIFEKIHIVMENAKQINFLDRDSYTDYLASEIRTIMNEDRELRCDLNEITEHIMLILNDIRESIANQNRPKLIMECMKLDLSIDNASRLSHILIDKTDITSVQIKDIIVKFVKFIKYSRYKNTTNVKSYLLCKNNLDIL